MIFMELSEKSILEIIAFMKASITMKWLMAMED